MAKQRYGWQSAPREDPDRQFLKLVASRVRLWRVIQVATLVLALSASVSSMNAGQPGPAASTVSLNAAGKQAAYAAVDDWLANDPLNTAGQIVSWDGAHRVSLSDGRGEVSGMRHTLTVHSADGRWWTVEQTIADGHPVGDPSVRPVAVQSDSSTAVEWGHVLADAQASRALTDMAQQWAAAYYGSDAARLKTVMADPDPDAVYQPLMLDGETSVNVGRVAYLDRGKVDRQEKTSVTAVTRVDVTLTPTGGMKAPSQYSYDLLVSDPDGTPRVLAWGAPGTGPDLKEHANRWHADPLVKTDVQENSGDGSSAGAGKTDAGQ